MTGSAPGAVEVKQVTRRFGEVTALDAVSLHIQPGEFFSLLGPSGCGKTTLLRIIAGLESPDSGQVRLDGQEATKLPAHRRPVNTVFQSYALFPHLNVHDNVAFGLRMKKVPRPDIERRVQAALGMVELGELGQRRPHQLSGGQKQRVALARALVNEPKVLLLDEPLAALDVKLRKQLQTELRSLQRRLGITFLYVTHDQEEALVLSDRLAVMNRGRILQTGTPRELYQRPRTRFCSQFLGACLLLEGATLQAPDEATVVSTALGNLRVAGPLPNRACITLAIRPEQIELRRPGSGTAENCVPAVVETAVYAGAETHYELRAGDQRLRAEVMNTGNGAPRFAAGDSALAHLPPEALILLDD